MLISILIAFTAPRTLAVGPGQMFAEPALALAAAHEGDTILVYPKTGGYGSVALRVTVPRLTIEGVDLPTLNGAKADTSGQGSHPRAVVEFSPSATGSQLVGFSLVGAHNASHNGAGVRVNGAADIRIEGCAVDGNDMGIMSNGVTGLSIEGCHIFKNGDPSDAGYNHNLYLGGNDATIRHCEIDHARTGHNVKSRCHFTLIEDCYLHDAHEREFDFVDAAETAAPHANAVLVNTVLVKGNNPEGNHQVIHFGPEKETRDGGLWLIHCTVLTPFTAPVLAMGGPAATAEIDQCVIAKTTGGPATLAVADQGASMLDVSGSANWISRGMDVLHTRLDPGSTQSGVFAALQLSATTFVATGLPAVPTPDPAYYRDGKGLQIEVTPNSQLGARWTPLHFPGS